MVSEDEQLEKCGFGYMLWSDCMDESWRVYRPEAATKSQRKKAA